MLRKNTGVKKEERGKQYSHTNDHHPRLTIQEKIRKWLFKFLSLLLSSHRHQPVASLSSWKNFWLNIKATPLISSTLASAVVFRLIKFAVMAMASLPRNSFRRNPGWKEIFRSGNSWLERKEDHFKQEGVLITSGNVGDGNQ